MHLVVDFSFLGLASSLHNISSCTWRIVIVVNSVMITACSLTTRSCGCARRPQCAMHIAEPGRSRFRRPMSSKIIRESHDCETKTSDLRNSRCCAISGPLIASSDPWGVWACLTGEVIRAPNATRIPLCIMSFVVTTCTVGARVMQRQGHLACGLSATLSWGRS